MKVVAIGDTHGRNYGRNILDQESGGIDKLIFLGDFFDHRTIPREKQMYNFFDIVALKEFYTEKTILILGNHDFHYLPVCQTKDPKKGYDTDFEREIQAHLEDFIRRELLQAAQVIDAVLYTHAGVTQTWLENSNYRGSSIGDVVRHINTLLREEPSYFNKQNGPLYVRPDTLIEDAYPGKQVVGHTKNSSIKFSQSGEIAFIDALHEGQYLGVDDGVFSERSISIEEGV